MILLVSPGIYDCNSFPCLRHNIQIDKVALLVADPPLQDLECPLPVLNSLFMNSLSYLVPFGISGTVNTAKEENQLVTELFNDTFFFRNPTLCPGLLKTKIYLIFYISFLVSFGFKPSFPISQL